MINASSTVKVTLEIDQDTNLDELMAHIGMMQGSIPVPAVEQDRQLADFSIHEGVLTPADGSFHFS